MAAVSSPVRVDSRRVSVDSRRVTSDRRCVAFDTIRFCSDNGGNGDTIFLHLVTEMLSCPAVPIRPSQIRRDACGDQKVPGSLLHCLLFSHPKAEGNGLAYAHRPEGPVPLNSSPLVSSVLFSLLASPANWPEPRQPRPAPELPEPDLRRSTARTRPVPCRQPA